MRSIMIQNRDDSSSADSFQHSGGIDDVPRITAGRATGPPRGSPWDDLRHQIFLGSAPWLERMRGWIESEERSLEIPRTQRCIARPGVEMVIETVAEVMELDATEITESRGGLARTLVAQLAFREGLVRLHKIARSLTLRSSGHISNLVRRAGEEIQQHRDVAAIAGQCLARLRPATVAVV